MKTGDAKPPNYRATMGATSAGPPDSTDEIGLSALSCSCLCDGEVEMRRRNIHEKFNVLCPLFAYSGERSFAGGRRLAMGGGDVAKADIGFNFLS